MSINMPVEAVLILIAMPGQNMDLMPDFGRLYKRKRSRTNLDLMPVKLGLFHHQMITSVGAGFMIVKDHTSLEADFLTVLRLTLIETIKHVKIIMPTLDAVCW